MKPIIKRTLWGVGLLLVVAFGAFLYNIPPFFLIPPETFAKDSDAAPSVSGIADPALRAIAERGRDLVVMTGCIGCHQTPGPQGPQLDKYLAGGVRFQSPEGTTVSRNLTPDPETGIGKRTPDELKRVLRSGVFPDGHVVSHTVMPWAVFSNWTDEDRHAVVVYLGTLKPIRHQIPSPTKAPGATRYPDSVEEVYAGTDYGSFPK